MSPLLSYAIQSGIWAAAGFLAGFLAGRVARVARDIRPVYRDADTPEEAVMRTDQPRSPWWTRSIVRPLIGILVLTLGLFTAIQGVVQSAELRRVSDCQRAYSTAFAAALDARTQASGDAQNALDALMTSVGAVMQSGDPARRGELQRAIRDYLAARAKAKQAQQAHPYPPAPRDLCK